jgi:hypothetical protein
MDIIPTNLDKSLTPSHLLIFSCSCSHSSSDPNDSVVSLQARQLGMTVENVLERTIVRSVYPNSEAFRLNVQPNSLILSIGASK